MAQVTLRKVVKFYDDVEAVSAIDLDIADKNSSCWSARQAAASRRPCA
jgi:ABC-type sugar transport system ATPase subunit